jgi:hypothetical protein
MGGGLMQLVAYGAQDIYLTGNPQITFFKVVYRRHTNFSMEAIEQTWNGTQIGASAARCTATISRNGDLVHRMYLQFKGTTKGTPSNPTASTIESVEIEIGGQKIDKHTGAFLETYAELTEPNPSGHVGDGAHATPTGTTFQNMSCMGGSVCTDTAVDTHVPLQFWFCRNPGLALPLIALQYHEVKVTLNWSGQTIWDGAGLTDNNLWADYIYLDTDERRRFAQVSHEYLIEQVQESSISATGNSDLNFNHPVKELIWIVAPEKHIAAFQLITLSTGAPTYQLKLNGHDRFAARDYRYFTRTQVWQHHTGCGGLKPVSAPAGPGALNDGIGVYSFALKPEEHQPSGTCNFSRIDNAQFCVTSGNSAATMMYAVNYNVLRIMSGMGGLAYSN